MVGAQPSMSDPIVTPPYTGSLLLASPAMRDPNFSRTVIFMAAHSMQDGAFGYVLNRPLDQRVADCCQIRNSVASERCLCLSAVR